MMKKISVFILSLLVLFSCKQNTSSIKSILKIHSIAIDGVTMNEEALKKGSEVVNYQDGHFELKIDAEVLNVKAFLSVGSNEREITENVISGVSFIVNASKDVLCKINFAGEGISKEYKFNIHKLPKGQNMAPSLTSLTVGGKEITGSDIQDEMSISLSTFSERIPISWKVDKGAKVKVLPDMQEGMIVGSFDEEKEFYIELKGEATRTYKFTLRLANANVTEDELRLTFLKVFGKEIKPINERNYFLLKHDDPYNIPLEVLANNGADIEIEPATKNGKIEVPFNRKETVVKITCKREKFTSRTYFLNIEREQEKAGLRSLKVNGHLIEIKDEMNVTTTYAKDKALIEAVGKHGTTVSFNPSLDSDNKIDLTQGVAKQIEITVTKPGVLSHVYKLNLTRETTPSSPRPSNVESVMIALGHDATRNFSEMGEDFPLRKDSVKYEINRENNYTLRVEKLNAADVITVIGSNGNEIAPKKTEGNVHFYNLTLKEVDSEKSSIEEVKIKINEQNMQERIVTCKMCFQGAWAEATKRPIAKIASNTFEPLLTKINYLSEGGRLQLMLEAYDSLSTLKQADGVSDFPTEIDVGEDVVEIGFVLTTVTDKKIFHKVRFKKAVKEERTLLEYLKFYPKEPDVASGYFKEYSNKLSPLFMSEKNEYKLEVKAGDDKVFFDLKPIIKEANVRVRVNSQLISKEEYFKDFQGNRVDLYALEISPKEVKTLSIDVISDIDSSMERNYIVTVVAPDDDIVTNFDAIFSDSNGSNLPTLPAIGKGGIRLPPQKYDGGVIKMKLVAKAEGMTFLAKQALIEFNEKGKASIKSVKDIALGEDNNAVLTTDIGMNYIVIQAKARNGYSKIERTYEVYKFSQSNVVKFELSDSRNQKVIEPTHYQMLEDLSLSAPITFRGFGGSKFAVQPFSDAQGNKPIKPTRVDFTTYTIPEVPKVMLIGVLMPDNAQLYYAVFRK